jgi:diphthamide synthase (EF-2-diphthine--ammonia ligase)
MRAAISTPGFSKASALKSTVGENGEFHTFVYAAPVFPRQIHVQIGEIVERDGFIFADVING